MSGAPGDFEDFVTARWRELHAVATLTTGDADDGARVTASALAALGRRWAETVDEGTPTAAARVAVLSAALTAARREAAPPREAAEPPDLSEVDDDGTRVALAAVLAAANPTARAALAVEHWWDESPALVAATGHTDLATVQADLSELRRQLAAAHAASLGRDEAELGWALSAATTDTLEHADGAPVGDPVALVEDARTKGTRRRRTRTAALAAVLALVVAGATALARPGPAPTTTPALARDSPRWNVVSSWTPRGPLVDDPTVRTIVAGVTRVDPPARLLYAGQVGDTITVVMMGTAPVDPSIPDGVPGPALGEGFDGPLPFLRLWTAPARVGPRGLAPQRLFGDATPRTGDLVALSVEQDAEGAAPAVLVMTLPTVTDVYVSTGALPQPDGSHLSVVQVLPLVDGVAGFTGANDGFTPRIATSGYNGPPAGAVPSYDQLPPNGPAEDVADTQRRLLAGVTGHSEDSLRTTSVLEATVPADAVPDFLGTDPGPIRVTVVTTFTPEGGRVRTSRLVGSNPKGAWTYLELLGVVPATDPHALLLLPTSSAPGFVAVAPDGAIAQLVTQDGQVRASAKIHQGLATLWTSKDPLGTTFRLRVLAPDGHVVYDEVPPQSEELAY